MSEEQETTTTKTRRTPAFLRMIHGFLGLYVMIAIPVLLVLISARMVMTPTFLQFEYNRPGFPEDIYGFSTEERLNYAPYALEYMLNGEGIDYLGDLTFPDGEPLYNERELRHMVDVKNVTQAAFQGLLIVGLTFLFVAWELFRSDKRALRLALINGATMTIVIIVMIVLMAVVAWDQFFDAFHRTFFTDGTWVFRFSDTLIRLFPQQFWFDAAVTIGVLTSIGALLILLFSWRWRISSR